MSVFHAYDIRGKSPQEIDGAFARRLARALIVRYAPKTVFVGRDMRLTSPELEQALTDELCASGVRVIRIGLCTTPMFNVCVGLSSEKIDLGVMVTASHNPGIYNGFKLVTGDVRPIGQGSGMEELEAMFVDGSEMPIEKAMPVQRGTVVDDRDAVRRYVDHVLALAALPSDLPRMKIAIDAGNGMAGVVLTELLPRLPCLDVEMLYAEPDGSFPNHEANPLKRETLLDVCTRVRERGCVLGVAFDGDADRIGFIDEQAEPIPGDIMTALVGQELVRQNHGGLVLYDLRSSWSIPEAIEAVGGQARMCRVGHAFIKQQMRDERALFAGEVSMHYYFKDVFNVESGDLLLLLLLKRLALEGQAMSALWRPLQKYAHSGEMNFTVQDKVVALERVRARFETQATSISTIDGIRMEFRDSAHPEHDWWFSLRLSNTEPLMRLNAEARVKDVMTQKVAELSAIIQSS